MGTVGQFRRAHIIPAAFMRRAAAAPFMEGDGISRSKKRFTGWYDENILGAEGEALIARYDNAAARCFIGRGYTYRTRRSPIDLNQIVDNFIAGQIYEIDNVDVVQLRLFALSLLWRAAITSLPAFDRIVVSPSHLRDIGARLRAGDPGDYRDYPVQFGVFDGTEELTKMAPMPARSSPIVRFFLDGVVCYVCPRRRWREVEDYGGLIAGYRPDSIALYCHASSGSWHDITTSAMMRETFNREGDVFAGFGKPRRQR